jgi:branched-chain amino acid transport system ATP-binding protein
LSAALAARGVSGGYGDVTVIRDLDLHVDSGEVVVLLGRNGAGKTTSLLTLSGAMRPSAGVVHFLGQPDTSSLQRRARRGLGLMTDDRSVFFGLTVRDNLRLARGSENPTDFFPELERLLDRPAGLISGGEQQMLGLATVLVRQPKVLLIDELSLGLAPVIVKRLLEVVRAAADRGTAVLLVEQSVRTTIGVADRAYVLLNGRIVSEVSASELGENVAEIERYYMATA